MNQDFDSTDRKPVDYVLFALGFLGFLTAAGGIVLGSPGIAIGGGAMLVLPVLCFQARPAPGE